MLHWRYPLLMAIPQWRIVFDNVNVMEWALLGINPIVTTHHKLYGDAERCAGLTLLCDPGASMLCFLTVYTYTYTYT